ncbi:hypothetical protein FHX52_1994 [Humibacillus xanthopallidus]|uniref:Uncharacterized protein n=1 Tax=Humibacillus xanthopallidus TaxID=412689 RepID=A0A543PXS0_9MICO|nr:hypothetical protein [Humibacillus xanthopallidus]TQN48841.1 hypothetical protein FHX52_1994 [Humibacillus xanthopallidus]
MTWLSIVLIGLGVGDLVRSSSWSRARLVAHITTPVVVAVVAVLADVDAWADVVALVLALGVAAAWMELSRRTQRTGHGALAALGTFAVLVAGLIGFSGAASTPGGPLASWLAWADLPGLATPSAARLLVLTGLVAFNIATANVIVRLVLLAIGALRPDMVAAAAPTVPAVPPGQSSQPGQPADRLKGGRLLGPMERLVILGLGLVGEFGAAGIVIAAKGLLRFPEIQAAARNNAAGGYTGGTAGIDDVTEYFLVGSFVSWLIALASLALAA